MFGKLRARGRAEERSRAVGSDRPPHATKSVGENARNDNGVKFSKAAGMADDGVDCPDRKERTEFDVLEEGVDSLFVQHLNKRPLPTLSVPCDVREVDSNHVHNLSTNHMAAVNDSCKTVEEPVDGTIPITVPEGSSEGIDALLTEAQDAEVVQDTASRAKASREEVPQVPGQAPEQGKTVSELGPTVPPDSSNSEPKKGDRGASTARRRRKKSNKKKGP